MIYALWDYTKADANTTTYFSLYGRRMFLGGDLLNATRKISTDRFGNEVVGKAEKIIDKYLVTYDLDEQKALAQELTALLGDIPPQTEMPTPPLKSRQANAGREEKKLSEELEQELNAEEEKVEGEQENSGGKEGEDAGSNKQDCDDDVGVKDLIKEELEKVMDKLEEEVAEVKNRIGRENGIGAGDDDFVGQFGDFFAEQKHLQTSQRIYSVLRALKNELENKTVIRQRRGRINLRAVMGRESHTNTDFKRFLPSRIDKSKMIVSLLIDGSGSMTQTEFDVAVGGAWSISHALERIGARVEVQEFSGDYRVMKKFATRTDSARFGRAYNGPTELLKCLKSAKENIANEKARQGGNGVVIALTDGGYARENEVHTLVRAMRKEGNEVFLIRIKLSDYGYAVFVAPDSGYSSIVKVKNLQDLPKAMGKIILTMQHKLVNREKRVRG
jgi:uncharacterized protein with von Willebrand factor type A (vWA) domain